MPGSLDPYTYPGTDVLRNIPDIRDPQRLAAFEANATVARLVAADAAPLEGRFDAAHLKAIHRYIFQDVYPWAGQFRTVNISKSGAMFAAAQFVDPALQAILRKLPGENYLAGTGIEWFAIRAGFYLGEINAVHPFRDGNGRAQREFIRELGVKAGFPIDWSKTDRDEMIAASRESLETGRSSRLAALVRAATVERSIQRP
ncbi:MAG: Fic family protein [Acidobacteriia bacterium]|nr:Fic family protein [Terriglobia bacterium]